MTLKNSFLASMKENNKRRLWLWLMSALAFIIVVPATVGIYISRTLGDMEYYVETMGAEAGRQALQANLLNNMSYILGVRNDIMMLLIAACGVVSAIQGFSFLYSKRKIDFYMGMPVKKKKRFWIIWLNGILVFFLPYLIGTGISGIIALTNGAMNAAVFQEMLQAWGLYLCFYLGVYHIAILAVMLTGNVIITCFGTAVLFLYEFGVRMAVQGYMGLFFKHYSYYGFDTSPILSPFAILYKFVQKHQIGQGNPWLTALYLLLFAAGLGAVAYICYLKRPAEAAGHAMAFSLPSPYIKMLITILATLIAGLVVSDMVGYAPIRKENGLSYVIFTMAVVLIVCSCLIQVIYEFDIKGIFHKKWHILISAVVTAAVFGLFRFDLFGYDSYVPSADRVLSAALSVNDYSYYYGENYFDEKMNYISKPEYINQNMYLTDPGALCKLARLSVDSVNAMDSIPNIGGETEGEWYSAKVFFRMGKNRTVTRSIYINVADEESAALLDEIMSQKEFISGNYIGASEVLEQIMAQPEIKPEAYYGNSVYNQKLGKEEAEELLRRYRNDIQNISFTKMRENMPAGSLVFSIKRSKRGNGVSNYSIQTMQRETELRIYPFFTECVSYLKERGYYMDFNLNPEDVERIQVTNYHPELEEKRKKELEASGAMPVEGPETVIDWGSTNVYGMEGSEFKRSAVYDDQQQIGELCKSLYPASTVYRSFSVDKDSAEGIEVSVYFKPGSEVQKSYGSVANYVFIEGEVPAFVEKDTEYTE